MREREREREREKVYDVLKLINSWQNLMFIVFLFFQEEIVDMSSIEDSKWVDGWIDRNNGWINEWLYREDGWMTGKMKIELTLTLKIILAGPLQTWLQLNSLWTGTPTWIDEVSCYRD